MSDDGKLPENLPSQILAPPGEGIIATGKFSSRCCDISMNKTNIMKYFSSVAYIYNV